MIKPCYELIEKGQLEKMSTVNLIHLMRAYEFGYYHDTSMDCYMGNCKCHEMCDKNRAVMVMRIYDILKTRPHIPNKKEAKALRQQRAAKRFKTVSAR